VGGWVAVCVCGGGGGEALGRPAQCMVQVTKHCTRMPSSARPTHLGSQPSNTYPPNPPAPLSSPDPHSHHHPHFDLSPLQDVLMDRRAVYQVLRDNNIPTPTHIVVNRDNLPPGADPPGFIEEVRAVRRGDEYVAAAREVYRGGEGGPGCVSTTGLVRTLDAPGGEQLCVCHVWERGPCSSYTNSTPQSALARAVDGRTGDSCQHVAAGRAHRGWVEQQGMRQGHRRTLLHPVPTRALSPPFQPPQEDYVELDGVRIAKPFVEKPVSGEDHNIWIFYPSSMVRGQRQGGRVEVPLRRKGCVRVCMCGNGRVGRVRGQVWGNAGVYLEWRCPLGQEGWGGGGGGGGSNRAGRAGRMHDSTCRRCFHLSYAVAGHPPSCPASPLLRAAA
jgi:hypothetical protein